MSNIKWNYWLPGLGIALLMQDQGAYMNTREERRLVWYHVLFGIALVGLIMASILV